MSAAQDLTGQRFGRLVAIKSVGVSVHKRKIWLCKCDCGNTSEVLSNVLIMMAIMNLIIVFGLQPKYRMQIKEKKVNRM